MKGDQLALSPLLLSLSKVSGNPYGVAGFFLPLFFGAKKDAIHHIAQTMMTMVSKGSMMGPNAVGNNFHPTSPAINSVIAVRFPDEKHTWLMSLPIAGTAHTTNTHVLPPIQSRTVSKPDVNLFMFGLR